MQEAPRAKVNYKASFTQEMQDFFRRNPNVLGGVDVLNLDLQSPQVRAGMTVAVLAGLVDAKRRPAVRGFTVVLPPKSMLEEADEAVWDEFAGTFHILAGRELSTSEYDWYRARLRVVATDDRRTRSVLEVIAMESRQVAVIVTEAAGYREDTIDPYVPSGALTPLLPEDVWVPQLHGLASSAVKLARERMIYVALDTNCVSPSRRALSDLLLSIEGCGVLGSSREEDADSILAARVDQWDAWIRQGLLGRALRDVDQLPSKLDSNKCYLRIQLLHKAGHLPQALQAIREEVASGRKLDVHLRVKLARIAQDANASGLAKELLGPAVDQLESREELESALATALDVGAEELEERIAERLGEVFPGAQSLLQRRQRALLASGNYGDAAALMASNPHDTGGADFYSTLARAFSGPGIPDYHVLIASAGKDAPKSEAYRIACVQDALRRKLVVHAFHLAMPLPRTPDQTTRGERLLLQALEGILLHDKGGTLPVATDRVQEALLSLIKRLAGNPLNHGLRVGLASLLQPQLAGTRGLALIAFIVLELASRPIQIERSRSLGTSGMTWLMSHKPFLDTALGWLKGEEPVVIGRSVLPEELLSEPADEVVSSIASYLELAPIKSLTDISAQQVWLALATAVTPHASNPDFELVLMRIVAGKFASTGYRQYARDLAEQTLLNSVATSRRRRLGWFAMADVYHRCHNFIEGLVAMACTLAANEKGDEEQVWHEVTCIVRFMRDCGLHDQARLALRTARQLLDRMKVSELSLSRLDTLELQIRQMVVEISRSWSSELEPLLADAVRHGEAVLKHHEPTEPALAMLSQLLRHAKENGVSIPLDADKVSAELSRHARGAISSLISALSVTEPLPTDLLTVLQTSEIGALLG